MRWPPADAQRVSLRAHLSQQAGRCQAYGAPAGLTPDEAALTVEQNVLTLERRRRERSAQPAGRKADAPALGRTSRGGVSEGFWNRAFAPKPALPSARADPGKSAL